MNKGSEAGIPDGKRNGDAGFQDAAWARFRAYCSHELRYGEIKLQIQDGVPVLAEYVKKKIKFT